MDQGVEIKFPHPDIGKNQHKILILFKEFVWSMSGAPRPTTRFFLPSGPAPLRSGIRA